MGPFNGRELLRRGLSVGGFYVNFAVKGADPRQVADDLERAGRCALVTPLHHGYVVVYDKAADSQATKAILTVGRLLSSEAGHPVLAVANHDNDVLCYWLFEGGEMVDAYNSNPEYFEEDGGAPTRQSRDAEKLCTLLEAGADVAAVEAILCGDYVSAEERHKEFAEAVRLPSWSVGLGYRFMEFYVNNPGLIRHPRSVTAAGYDYMPEDGEMNSRLLKHVGGRPA
jgi:hypothetical protein